MKQVLNGNSFWENLMGFEPSTYQPKSFGFSEFLPYGYIVTHLG